MPVRINQNPADVDTTLVLMQELFPLAVQQVDEIALRVKGVSVHHTTQNLYRYLKKTYRYAVDPSGMEYIRTPHQSLLDRKKGIDCEDFSLIAAAVLHQLGIYCRYQIVDFNGIGFSHIYVVILDKAKEIILDATHERFNHQEKYMRKKDYPVFKKPAQKITFRTHKTLGLGRIGVDPVLARQKGKFVDMGNTYIRQQEIIRLIPGRKTKVAFTFDKVIDCQYMILSAEDLQPSHLGNVENPLHFLPEAQPRNRATSQSGAETPQKMASSLRPAEIVEGANAYTGAPVVNARGEVIQGNGRAYALKVYWKTNVQDSRGYRDYLEENAPFLGFPARISLKDPVLVRMVKVTDEEAIRLGQYKQSDLEAVSTRTNEVKSRVNLLDAKKLAGVLDRVFSQVEPDQSLAEIIRETNLLSQLVRLGAIRPDQLEEYTRNGTINARGVAFVSDLLLFLIFKGADVNTPELFAQLPVRIQNAIIKATPSLLRVDEEKHIKKEVSNAILATRDYLNSSESSVKAWEKTIDIFGQTPQKRFSPLERRLVEILTTAKTQREITESFEQYAFLVTDKEADLVSPFQKGLSKSEGIEVAFFGKDLSMVARNQQVVLPKNSESQAQRIRILRLKYKYQR